MTFTMVSRSALARRLRPLWPGPFQSEKPLALWGLLPALALFSAAFALHEPWRDEIQAWLMAGNLSLPGLLANAGAEGHPIGWHLLCKFLMALGLPFSSLYALSALCALLAALLLARRSPFSPLLKLLAVSGPLILLLGISARPYMLIVLLLLLQAALFAQRMRRPLAYALCLGALSQLMVLCLPYAGLMALWWLLEVLDRKAPQTGPVRLAVPARPCECRQSPAPVLILAQLLLWSLLLFAVWQLLPPWEKLLLMLDGRATALGQWSEKQAFAPLDLLLPASGLAFSLFMLHALYRFHAFLALAGLCCLLFALGVDTFVYPLSTCHWHTMLAILLALGWTALGPAFAARGDRDKKNALTAALSLAALWALLTGAPLYLQELRLPSSNLAAASAYARQHLGRSAVAVHSMAKICPLLKDMPEQSFWNPVSRSWGRFAVFDAAWQRNRYMSVDEAAKIILAFCPEPFPVLIFSAPWTRAAENNYRLVIEFSDPTVYGEDFYFYHADAPPLATTP